MKTLRYLITAAVIPVILAAGYWYAARSWTNLPDTDSYPLTGTWLYAAVSAEHPQSIPADKWRPIELRPGALLPLTQDGAPVFWVKRRFTLEASFINRNPGLIVGRVTHACGVVLNGLSIGGTPGFEATGPDTGPVTSDWNTYRHYPLVSGILKPGENEILLRVTAMAGIPPFRDPLRLTAAPYFERSRLFWNLACTALYQFFSAALAMGAAMFLASYLIRRRDRHFLYYAIIAGSLGIYLSMFFIFTITGSGFFLYRLYYLVPIVAAWSYCLLAASIAESSRRIPLIIGAVALMVSAILCAVLPWHQLAVASITAHGSAGLLFIIAAYHLFRGMAHGAGEARILAPWTVLILASLIIDNASYRYSSSIFTLPVSAGFGIATLGIWYAIQMARSRNELEDLTATLEQKVQSRTEEMDMVTRTFTEINDNLMDATRELEDYEISTRKDMALAANIQRSILPAATPPIGVWETAFIFKPMADVSGDFYDFYDIDGRFGGLGIFDVSGHGVSSGLITMIAKSAAWRQFRRGIGAPLAEVMAGINREILRDLTNVDNYLTGIILRFDDDTMECVNAGHPELLVRRDDTVTGATLPDGGAGTGTLLGIPDIPTEYPIIRLTVVPGDFYLVYTDCIIEARAGNEPYGAVRLAESFSRGPLTSAHEMLDHILEDFYRYMGSRETLRDDLTVIVLKRTRR